MKKPLFVFLKYPYIAAIIVIVWLSSAVMIFIDRSLPIIAMLCMNLLLTWGLSWAGSKPQRHL